MGLTEEDLATRAGTTIERLRELIAIGIIRPGPSEAEPFSEGDALRVLLVEHLADSDIPPTSVAGPITYTDGDYYGLAVIIAARIASTAGPGDVLVGESVVQASVPEGVRFEEIGPVVLKGVRRPERIFRAVREAAVEGAR